MDNVICQPRFNFLTEQTEPDCQESSDLTAPCWRVYLQSAKMPLAFILEKKVTLTDFLGFDKVNIDYKTLHYIVSDNILSWKTALSKVKGVYLIVDTLTGKQYVGSAYGDECVWQRWSDYAKNGHGGNKELKELLTLNGEKYKYNFKYSILEVCNMNLGDEYIIEREGYWKEVLLTRKFGLNKN